MTEGDGIRRNVAYVDRTEKQHLKDAIIKLHTDKDSHYPGVRDDPIPGGVSYWFKQDEIHQATHVHGGEAFLTWHRELCNRFEDLLREVNRNLSLHYWDWTTNPTPLFTSDFMGNANGPVEEPWRTPGFYKPDVKDEHYRADDPFDTAHNNPFDPPKNLTRYTGDTRRLGPSSLAEDNRVIASRTYPEMRLILEGIHDNAHTYFDKPDGKTKSTMGNAHTAFRDPFIFLLHSNVDRLFAMWQWQDPIRRFDPEQVYGTDSPSTSSGRDVGILTPLEPWAGVDAPGAEKGLKPVRPWAPPEKKLEVKNSKHISVVIPRRYDTTPPIILLKTIETKMMETLPTTKQILKDLDIKILKEIPEVKVPEHKEIPEGNVPKVPEQMSTDIGSFAKRLGRIEERLATMESFIRPDERPQLGHKDRRQAKNNDDEEDQTEE